RGVLQQLGIWQRMPTDQVAPLREARVIDGPGLQGSAGGPLCFARPPGTEALGWLVPNHHIRRAAHQAARARPAVRWCTGARVTTLALSGPLARVGLAAGLVDGLADGRADGQADGRQLAAPLVVAADSRFSGTRRLAGIGAEQRDFGRSVIVGRVAHASVDHQGIAWECFGHGQTLALLPMNQRQCSAVVTVPSDQAPAWLALDDTGFARQVQQLAASRLGPLQAVGPRHHYPLVGVYAHAFSTRRLALVG
ncbi:MAG: monooxygenase, partial [Burkholderiales bacterium PBB5]